jgi:hypothetical protein
MAQFPAVELRMGAVEPAMPGRRQMAALLRHGNRKRPTGALGLRWTILVPSSLAAALGLACVGLAWRLQVLDSRLKEARGAIARLEGETADRPALAHSFEILSLQPIGAGEVRGPADSAPTEVHETVPVVLNAYLPGRGPYSVELVGTDGKLWQTWNGLEPTSRKNLTLVLAPSKWPPGRYEFRIQGPETEAGPPLARFEFTIRN